jgi:hypothetical protein
VESRFFEGSDRLDIEPSLSGADGSESGEMSSEKRAS